MNLEIYFLIHYFKIISGLHKLLPLNLDNTPYSTIKEWLFAYYSSLHDDINYDRINKASAYFIDKVNH